MFKGTKDLKPGEFSRRVAALGGRENAFTTRDYTGFYQQIPAGKLEAGDEAGVRPLRQQPVARRRVQARDRGGQGRAPHAHRRPAARPARRAAERRRLHRVALPPPGGRLDERPRRDDARRRARLPQALVRARQCGASSSPATSTWRRCAAWPRNTTAASPRVRVPVRKPRIEPEQRGIRRVEFKAPAEQAYVLARLPRAADRRRQVRRRRRSPRRCVVLSAVLDGYSGARLDRALTQGPDRVADSAGAYCRLHRPRPAAVRARGRSGRRQDARSGRGGAARRSGAHRHAKASARPNWRASRRSGWPAKPTSSTP